MSYHRSIIFFILRLAARLFILCLVMISLAAIVGNAIQPLLISYIVTTGNEFEGYDDTLYVMDIRVELSAKVTEQTAITSLSWSPDGTRIAFGRDDGQTFIWDRHDNTLRAIGTSDVLASISDWSPSGNVILESIAPDDGLPGIYYDNLYRVDLNSGIQTQLTSFNGTAIHDVDWASDDSFIVLNVASDMTTNFDWEIYRIDPDGSRPQQLTNAKTVYHTPRISPQGTRIIFISEQDGNGELYVMNKDGSEQRRLTWTDEYESLPSWSPDGTHILFLTVGPRKSYASQIHVMNADGSDTRLLTDDIASTVPGLCWLDKTHILYEIAGYQGAEIYLMDIDGRNTRQFVLNGETNHINFIFACPP